jgi:hypothetical protein
MSDDYLRGWQGAAPGIEPDMAEYDRGRNDRLAGRSAHPAGDLTPMYEKAIEVGRFYQQDPYGTLNKMLLFLAGATVFGGVVGYGLATILGPAWTPSPTAWAIQFGAVTFWLGGVWVWSLLTGVMRHTRTRRGVFVWLGLTLVLGYMLWSFLGPIVGGWTS